MKSQSIVPVAAMILLAACGGATYTATLSGAAEVPPVTTSGTGTATATLENNTTLVVSGSYSGLSGAATAAHIHGPADAGTNAAVVCSLTRTESDAGAGTLSGNCPNFDVTSLNNGLFYVNVHTAANPTGEVRGQLTKQ